jgi:catechol 2,3-dioxygenase-like lactoylglutathione lyase family enzyme
LPVARAALGGIRALTRFPTSALHAEKSLGPRRAIRRRTRTASTRGCRHRIETEALVPITTGFNHVATLTADLDRLVEFYAKAFEAEVTFEMEARADHPRMVVVDLGGGSALNVFETTADEIIGERRRQGGRGAIDHFALAVDSLETLERVRDRLVDAGADIGEIQQLGGEWSLFFRDPDGMELEVCAHAGGAA